MSVFAKLSMDVDADKEAMNGSGTSNEVKSDEVVEVDSQSQRQSEPQLQSESQSIGQTLSYRPQRTESPRTIRITSFEERV